MAKYKVGDKVRILDGSNIKDYIGIWVSDGMGEYVDKILTISKILSDDIEGVSYKMKDICFTFDERGLELVEKEIATMNITDFIRTPDIINYTYTPHIGLTTIEWSDGTRTTVRAEDPAKADQYTGFVTAYAKKAAGNTNNINNLFDEWTIERPKRETKRMCDEMVARIEAQKKQERDTKKREKRLIRREAIRIKREYEARKLANEKYGVPMDGE